MSEPMVRVVSALCPIHGERIYEPARGYWAHPPVEPDYTAPASEFRDPVFCAACGDRGERTQVVFATEPVDLEPREEQAG